MYGISMTKLNTLVACNCLIMYFTTTRILADNIYPWAEDSVTIGTLNFDHDTKIPVYEKMLIQLVCGFYDIEVQLKGHLFSPSLFFASPSKLDIDIIAATSISDNSFNLLHVTIHS